ncbi:hypothetical protein LCGC14_0452360 [marine sediment metagenome]|uniref:Uncharacterized protein n=1 Tax=marine sediment metagenome TaxID=412755 RepID=A0A0F9SHH9_9ZZZZ
MVSNIGRVVEHKRMVVELVHGERVEVDAMIASNNKIILKTLTDSGIKERIVDMFDVLDGSFKDETAGF